MGLMILHTENKWTRSIAYAEKSFHFYSGGPAQYINHARQRVLGSTNPYSLLLATRRYFAKASGTQWLLSL